MNKSNSFQVLKASYLRLQELYLPLQQRITQYWQGLKITERRLLAILAIFMLVVILWSFFTAMSTYQQQLQYQIHKLRIFQQLLPQYQYKASTLKQTNSQALTAESLKNTISTVLKIPEPDVSIQNSIVSLNLEDTNFQQLMGLLEILRINYSLFPQQFTMYRTKAGYVTAHLTLLLAK
jgi:type II secretory pathway component PulM